MCPTWNEGVRGEQVRPLIERDAQVIRVEAGPGTGKTFGLVRRVERILHPDGLGVHGRDVLVVAFNRVIAKQLESEISERLNTFEHVGNPTIRTIHALCLQVIGEDLRILLPHEWEAMVYDLLTQHQALRELYEDFDEAAQALRDHEAHVVEHLALWQAAREWLTRHHSQLLSDLPSLFLDRLRAGDLPDHRYDHIIVDEFQDLTPGEQELMSRLRREEGQLVVLGDPRQSIYRFRGNDLQGLANLPQIVGDDVIVDVPMQECQRCPREVVLAANRLMALADVQEMTPASRVPANIHVVVWDSLQDEADGMARAVVNNFRQHPNDQHLVMTTRRYFGYLFRDRVAELDPNLRIDLCFSESILETWAVREAFLFFCLLTDADAPTWRAWLGYENSPTGREYKAPRRNSAAYLQLLTSSHDSITEDAVRHLAQQERVARRGAGGSLLWDRARRFVELKEGLWRENASAEELIEAVFDDAVWVGPEFEESETARIDLGLLRATTLSMVQERMEGRPNVPSSEHLRPSQGDCDTQWAPGRSLLRKHPAT